MFDHKKISAFLLGITVCTAAFAPLSSAFADNEESSAAEDSFNIDDAALGTPDASEEEENEENNYITSGDYKYSLSDDDILCIEEYIGSGGDVVIPDTIDGKPVEEIGDRAFFESSAVTVTIPASVNYIADNPFMESKNLREIKVDKDNQYYFAENGVLYLDRSGKVVLLCYPHGKTDEKFAVPENVTTIGTASIYDTQLKEITLPAGLEYIYRHGLSYNTSLEKIDMSGCGSLGSISEMSFTGCDKLSEVALPPALTEIGNGAFAQCPSLKDIQLPDTLVTIGQNAFAATGLTKVIIPSSVTEIGYCAFGYDEDLKPLDNFVIIGDSGSAAETYATDEDEFYDYKNNFTFYDTSQADLIGESAELDIVTGDEYMYAVKDGEIYIMSCLLTSPAVEIPEKIDGKPVTCIYGAAFYQNEIKSVSIPDTVTKIGSIAFADCVSLESVKMPSGLVQIDDNAFAGCSSLQYIELPAGCETIGEDAFYGCTSLTEFKTAKDSKFFSAEDGVLYNSDKTMLVAYPCGKGEKYFKTPDSVTDINASAFAGCNFIETADLSSVVNIQKYAFEKCENLSSVVFTDKLKTVGDCAFYDCQSLLAVRLFENIEAIGNYAFGFHYDEHAHDGSTDARNDDFTIYAELDSGGIMYGLQNNLTCENDVSLYSPNAKAPAATFDIFGYKVRKAFVYAIGGIFGAAVLGALGVILFKKSKKKKNLGVPRSEGKEK